MLNFEDYQIINSSEDRKEFNIKEAFVGIRSSKESEIESEKPFFILPYGFEDIDEDNFSLNDFFVDLYKTFKVYKNHLDTQTNADKNKPKDGEYKLENEDDESAIFYSKLELIDSIIEFVEGESFIDFNTKIAPTKPFEIKSKYLENAIYQDDIAIIDEVLDNKKFLTTKPSIDILNMLIFIYSQINEKLKESSKNLKYRSFYNDFVEKFRLNQNDNIFGKNSKITIERLKDILDSIDKKTIYKDELYFDIYEAIEKFLYFNKMVKSKDIKWGIDNFNFVWEDICQKYLFDTREEDIIFADSSNYKKKNLKYFGFKECYVKDKNFDNPFYLQKSNEKNRYIYPDIVLNRKLDINLTKADIFNLDNIYKTTYDTDWSNHYYKLKIDISFINKFSSNEFFLNRYNLKKLELASWDRTSYVDKNQERDYTSERDRDRLYDRLTKKILEDISIKIIDFKNLSKEYLETDDKHLQIATTKQLVYELALKQHSDFKDSNIESEFWIPKYFDSDSEKIEIEIDIDNPLLKDREIIVKEINFLKLQKNYIGES